MPESQISPVGRLPGEATSFVGRRRETGEVRRVLSAARLVTLTGVAGVGKTRLAVHVASQVRRAFPDGVWMVDLADVREPSVLFHRVADVLELKDESARPPETVLVEHLADKRLLLVLDNCEHLLDSCARLVNLVLLGAPEARILATSREPLGVAGEHTWPVPALPVPEVTDVPVNRSVPDSGHPESEALALFEQRATEVRPDFALTLENVTEAARLCQRLDGLPLAIELAAVQVRELSVAQILDRIDDRYRLLTDRSLSAPSRHQTLWEAVEWSYDLCSADEQAVWAQLSVFAGGFDLDAARHVCAPDAARGPDAIFTAVIGLVEKSILSRHQHGSRTRYRMLETIRQFGRERLAFGGAEARLRRRHRDYYLALAERADTDSFGERQEEWFREFRDDHANFQVALDYCLTEPDEARSGLRMASALCFYWIGRGLVREGRQWLERLCVRDTTPTPERARALWVNGYVAARQGDIAGGLALLDECRDLAQALGADAVLAHAVDASGLAWMFNGDLDRAVPLLEEGLTLERRFSVPSRNLATALFRLSLAVGLSGDIARSDALSEECLALCEDYGDHWSLCWTLSGLSIVRWAQGDVEQTIVHAKESVRNGLHLDDPFGVAQAVEVLAWAATAQGDAQRATLLLGASNALWKPQGTHLFGHPFYLEWHDQCERRARESLGNQAFEAIYARGQSLGLDRAAADALDEEASAPDSAAQPSPSELTRRESEVAELVAHGLSNREIAHVLMISHRTVESHVQHVLNALGFASRAQIAAWAAERRLPPAT